MKYLEKKSELCISCHECENVCSKIWFKEQNPTKARIRIDEQNSSQKITTCTQCGECIDACPNEALSRDKNGVVQLNKSKCVGCFICVGYCPEQAMFMHVESHEPFKCIACGQCAKSCPEGAIFLNEKN